MPTFENKWKGNFMKRLLLLMTLFGLAVMQSCYNIDDEIEQQKIREIENEKQGKKEETDKKNVEDSKTKIIYCYDKDNVER